MAKKLKTVPKLNTVLLDEILARFNLSTNNYKYFTIALTHSTYANEHKTISNERIEFLGDAILGITTAEYIYNNFPTMLEGQMTKLRSIYVCEDANFKYAHSLRLDELLLLGAGEEATGGRKKKAVVADTFECFLGAVYKTFGMNSVVKILEVVVFPHILTNDDAQFTDYKTLLQEYFQADKKSIPVYNVVKEEGKPNEKVFTIEVVIDGIPYGVGSGPSKSSAGQQAAKDALSKLSKK